MIGARVGLKGSLLAALSTGVGTDQIAPPSGFVGITRDAASSIYYPSTAAEWTSFRSQAGLSIGQPDGCLLLQETSGALVDVLAGGYDMTNGGTAVLNNAVSDRTRKGVKLVEADATSYLYTTVGVPNVSASPIFAMLDVQFNLPQSTRRVVMYMGFDAVSVNNTPRIVADSVGNYAIGTVDPSSTTLPVGMWIDSVSTVMKVLTHAEVLTPTWGGASGNTLYIGKDTGDLSPDMIACYLAVWRATPSNAEIKAMYQARGYTMAW